jgi:hypothetical protein
LSFLQEQEGEAGQPVVQPDWQEDYCIDAFYDIQHKNKINYN